MFADSQDAHAVPTVSIVIPTYQGAAYLPQTLSAIRAQDYPAMVEIVAVDSESTDTTCEILQQFGATIIPIRQTQFTHGYSRNLGVQQAKGEAVVFLSQDALPIGTDWLRTLLAPLADRTIGATYARQIARPAATPFENYIHLSLYPPQSKRYQRDGQERLPLSRIFFSNVCSAAQREICRAFPFDETLIMSEDQAFARALLQAGYTTFYNAGAQVSHSHSYSLKALFRRNFDSAYSLRSISDDGPGGVAFQGLRYIMGEAAFVIRGGHWLWLLAIPGYEAARIAGRIFGHNADRLPQRWRLAFSLHRGYWLYKQNRHRNQITVQP